MLNGRVIMNVYDLCSLVTRERAKEMNDWYFLVRVGMRGNFEAALYCNCSNFMLLCKCNEYFLDRITFHLSSQKSDQCAHICGK